MDQTCSTNFPKRARWYDPITGRWLSNDPIDILGGLNQYAFCANSPINFVDLLGYYGSDVHSSVTLFYGLYDGVCPRDARSIACADNDFDSFGSRTWPILNPVPHFQGIAARSIIVDDLLIAAKWHDADRFGELLHQLQDTYAHQGYFLIHLPGSYSPDDFDPSSVRDTNMIAVTRQMLRLWLKYNPCR